MKKNKKAIIDIQFNWVFVLIVGFVMLVFFLSIVSSQRKENDQSLGVDLVQSLSAIFISTQQSSSTYKEIIIPENKIKFTCSEGISNFEIGSTGIKKDTPIQAIFAMKTVEGKEIQTWTLEWDAPFKVDYFLMVSSPNIEYVFVGDSPLINELYNETPDVSKVMIDVKNINKLPIGFKNYRLIFVNQNPVFPQKLDGVSAVVITQKGNVLDSYGDIDFYKGNRKTGNAQYLKQSSIYAAIFSEDAGIYQCNMDKALQRYKILTNIFLNKVESIQASSAQLPQICELLYPSPSDSLVEIQKELDGTEPPIYKNLYTSSEAIANANEDLKRANCPIIY